MISYKPLWKTLIDKDIKKTQLRDMAGFSSGTLSRLGKDQYVELKHIDRICQVLECGIADVIAVIPDSTSETQVTPK
ncbi:MAG: helix-turn-helix domain-containing protein [Hespellia sp.]|nr:helix-turn-helix domain-containing protein [Hespellia sp.]